MTGHERKGEATESAHLKAEPPVVEKGISPEGSVRMRFNTPPQREKGKDAVWSVADILGLQRAAGNGVVARMMSADVQRQAPPSGGSGTTGAAASGFTVDLAHAAKFDGQTLSDEPGFKENKGECATGIQYVFAKAGTRLDYTATWKQGPKVRGNNIPPGTAIASFRNGRYAKDHAAILIRETKHGLEVWDQYNDPPKAWGRRTLRFAKNKDRSNNGNMFFVITH